VSQILTFHIELVHISPPIWRKVEVPEELTLGGLHFLIQELFGWESYHLFDFRWNDECYSLPGHGWEHGLEAEGVTIRELIGESDGPLGYIYDYGDHWELELTVEERSWPEEGGDYPRCVAGERAGPPEDVGGPPMYAEVVEDWHDGTLEDHMEEWLADDFDPEAFDANAFELPDSDTLEERARDSVRRYQRSQGNTTLSDLATLVTAVKGDFLTVDGKEFTVDETLETYPVSNQLRDCLSRLPVNQLDTVANNVGIDGWPTLRGDREEAIAEILLSEGAVERELERLSDDARQLASDLADDPEPVHIRSVLEPRAARLERNWMIFSAGSGLGELRRHGLVHLGLRRDSGTERILCGMPDDLREQTT
jgi:hypothetical protein